MSSNPILHWRHLVRDLEEWQDCIQQFRHVSTRAWRDDGAPDLHRGQVLWAAATDDGMLGISWAWQEVSPQCVVMGDPLTVVSNVALRADGGYLDEPARLLQLNTAIYLLPWQYQVNVYCSRVTQARAA